MGLSKEEKFQYLGQRIKQYDGMIYEAQVNIIAARATGAEDVDELVERQETNIASLRKAKAALEQEARKLKVNSKKLRAVDGAEQVPS